MKRIGVFTSGGDSPGMNACLRAVVRTGLHMGLEVYGIYRGYEGMIEGDIIEMTSHSVSGIIQRGGTMLKTARSKEFMTEAGRKIAFDKLQEAGIEGLIVIGGDGSFRGAMALNKEHGIPVIGCPGTIDNDLYGTDYTIGYDTAVNTVVDAVDHIRDTADSHNRLFFIEVMGRDAGFIALRSSIASGAESVLIPETTTYIDRLIDILRKGWKRNKRSAMIIVAEGDESGGAYEVAKAVNSKFPEWETKVTVLGHIQRGGKPSAFDRVVASRMGNAAVRAILDGETNKMVGIQRGDMALTPFEKATKHHHKLNEHLVELVDVLS